MPVIQHRRTASLALAATFALGACGSSSSTDTAPSTDDVATTDDVASTDSAPTTPVPTGDLDALDVEFSSEPIDAGPLFGGGAGDSTGTEVAASCSNEGTEACNDFVEPSDPVEPFEPASVDAPFCGLLSDLDGRPFPSDEAEALTVARVWIGELRNVAVEGLHNDLDFFIELLDATIESGGGIDDLGDTPEMFEASTRIDDYVDMACDGIGVAEVPDEPPVTYDDPQLPDGLVIPVIEFDDASETGRPIFGEKDETEIDADFVPAEPDQEFCDALDIISTRPQPTDDVDEIRFVDGYLRAIAPVVPQEIEAEVAAVLDWTRRIVEAGDFTDEAEQELGDGLEDSIEAIDDFVDARCNGL